MISSFHWIKQPYIAGMVEYRCVCVYVFIYIHLTAWKIVHNKEKKYGKDTRQKEVVFCVHWRDSGQSRVHICDSRS